MFFGIVCGENQSQYQSQLRTTKTQLHPCVFWPNTLVSGTNQTAPKGLKQTSVGVALCLNGLRSLACTLWGRRVENHNVASVSLSPPPPSRFVSSFVDGLKFDVEFTVSRLTTRLQQRAAELADRHNLGNVLFPSGDPTIQPPKKQPLL